jgi:hypothetical protein
MCTKQQKKHKLQKISYINIMWKIILHTNWQGKYTSILYKKQILISSRVKISLYFEMLTQEMPLLPQP